MQRVLLRRLLIPPVSAETFRINGLLDEALPDQIPRGELETLHSKLLRSEWKEGCDRSFVDHRSQNLQYPPLTVLLGDEQLSYNSKE